MSDALTTKPPTWAGVVPNFRKIAVRALIYEVGWKVATLFLLGPLTTALLNTAIALGWESAVTNGELLRFGLSPLGIATLAGFGTLVLGIQFFEQAGLVILGVNAARGGKTSLRELARLTARDMPRLLAIAGLQVLAGAVVVAPFLLLAGLTYWLLLSGSDINYFLTYRPPRFLAAVAIGGVLAAGAGGVLAWLYIRWIYAVPASLFEGHSPIGALRASAVLVRGKARKVFGSIVIWQIGKFLAFLVLAYVLDFISGMILDAVGVHVPRVVVLSTVAFLVVANGAVLAVAAMVESISFSLLITLLYESSLLERGEAKHLPPPVSADPVKRMTRRRRMAVAFAVVLGVAAVTGCEAWVLAHKFTARHLVLVTAHRAGPKPAPENSLSALKAGIAAGADYAEIDVQKTRDGVIVVLHDEDLRRLAGVAKPIRDMTFDEARMADMGAAGDPKFRGEKLATLEEFIEAARGKIRLNIELKYYGHDPTLAKDVVALLRKQNFTDQCIVCSLDGVGLAEVRVIAPEIRLGSIVSVRIGDLTRLDVDALSLNYRLASAGLVASAHARGFDVMAWDVDEAQLAVRLINRGVDNLISDDPHAIRKVIAWYDGLSDIELILLRFHDWLGSSTFKKIIKKEQTEAQGD